MTFTGFERIEFTAEPKKDGIVYVFTYISGPGAVEKPFYVGETGRFDGRMSDYRMASFKAVTDFAVGEAAKYLRDEKGWSVYVRYKPSRDRKQDELTLISELSQTNKLLNDLERYDYRTATKQEELRRIHEFCNKLPT